MRLRHICNTTGTMACGTTLKYQRARLVATRTADINPYTQRSVRFLTGVKRTTVLNHMQLCVGGCVTNATGRTVWRDSIVVAWIRRISAAIDTGG